MTAWRPLRRTAPLLLAIAFVAAVVVLLQLAWALALGPIAAWDRVASQPAFRFPPSSPWVIGGRDLGVVRGGAPLVFDEVHRLTAPAGGILRARTLDGGRLAAIEWTLAPGQTVTLRAGDEVSRASTLRLRFEADKRVPGAPASGMAWADGGPRRWLERVGLAVTLLVGAAALLRAGLTVRLSRDRVGLAAGGLLLAFVWAQAWAVYALIQAPDLFLGGMTLERLLELPPHALFAEPWRRTLQILLLAAGLAAFLASSLALRERLGALDATGGGEIGHDPGLWAGLFGGAAVASLWPRGSVGAEPARPGRRGLRARAGRALAAAPRPRRGHRRASSGSSCSSGWPRSSSAARAADSWAPPSPIRPCAAAPAGALVLWLGRRVRP